MQTKSFQREENLLKAHRVSAPTPGLRCNQRWDLGGEDLVVQRIKAQPESGTLRLEIGFR